MPDPQSCTEQDANLVRSSYLPIPRDVNDLVMSMLEDSVAKAGLWQSSQLHLSLGMSIEDHQARHEWVVIDMVYTCTLPVVEQLG